MLEGMHDNLKIFSNCLAHKVAIDSALVPRTPRSAQGAGQRLRNMKTPRWCWSLNDSCCCFFYTHVTAICHGEGRLVATCEEKRPQTESPFFLLSSVLGGVHFKRWRGPSACFQKSEGKQKDEDHVEIGITGAMVVPWFLSPPVSGTLGTSPVPTGTDS